MKKVIWIFIIILVAIIISGILIFYSIFGNNKYDLKNISNMQRQNILLFLNCEEISDEIELTEMQIPKAYKDIYYEIYFQTNNNRVKEYISDAETNLYGIDIKGLKNNNYRCVIYRKDNKSIELFESIANRKEINNIKNEDTNEAITKKNEPLYLSSEIRSTF